ncbi:MAG: hypothetical protein JXA20_14635 [Spirochaetes bacterium]|nr:hypothetical protein [Spirochaetota bacterium]
MKRILLGTLFAALFSTAATANVFVDGYGALVGAGSARWQYGGGGALGFTLTRDFNILYRGMYSLYSKDRDFENVNYNPTYYELNFDHMMHLVGLEYMFPIDRFRLQWRSSVMAGFSMTTMEYEPVSGGLTQTKEDTGLSIALWTGIQFNATQHISPFIDLGMHMSFYQSELSDKSIVGLHVMVGVRFYIGDNRRIDDYY